MVDSELHDIRRAENITYIYIIYVIHNAVIYVMSTGYISRSHHHIPHRTTHTQCYGYTDIYCPDVRCIV